MGADNTPRRRRRLCTASGAARRARIHAEGLGRINRWRERRQAHRMHMAEFSSFDAREADKLAVASPSTGHVRGLCLLVDFPDRKATIGTSEVSDFLNQRGYSAHGNAGSVRDYFHDVSGGRLDFENEVPLRVHTASQPTTYWADPFIEYGRRASELLVETLDAAKTAGYDFTRLTRDAGLVNAVACIYPGEIVSSSPDRVDGLWPHQDIIWNDDYEAVPGIWVRDYQILNAGDALHLFTFCHETGHLLCDFNDLYDDDKDIAGVGDFCFMGYGGHRETEPVRPCGYHLIRAGWASRVTTLESRRSYAAKADVNEVFVYPHPSRPEEYFVVENRSQNGRDRQLPVAGLAIWHVDTAGSNTKTEMTPDSHYECSLEQADGKFHLETIPGNFGDTGDLFHADSLDHFGKNTTPSSRWWDGTESGLEIRDISKAGDTMTFRLE